MTRQPEAYHRRVLAGPTSNHTHCASIHDRVVFKQEGLERRVQYDPRPRKSLIDHFYNNDISAEAIWNGDAMERGDFASGIYEARLRRNPDRIRVVLTKHGNAWGIPLKITKGVTAEAGSSVLELAYLIEGLRADDVLHFAVEFNFAGLPAGAEDRYFYRGAGQPIGQLGSRLDLQDLDGLGLIDEWLGIDVHLSANRPTGFWTFPAETVSQSEGGFELVHQSAVVQPHWLVRGDAEGRWCVTMQLSLDTSRAERRHEMSRQAVAVG
jgi:alpha-amylase